MASKDPCYKSPGSGGLESCLSLLLLPFFVFFLLFVIFLNKMQLDKVVFIRIFFTQVSIQ